MISFICCYRPDCHAVHHRLDFSENPGVPHGAPSDHHPVGFTFLLKPYCLLCRKNITVSIYGNLNRLFYLGNHIPVCLSAVLLLPRSSVYGDRGNPVVFSYSRQFNRIDMVFVIPESHLYSYGNVGCSHGFAHHLARFFRCPHQPAAFSRWSDLFGWAPHVQIDSVIYPECRYSFGRLSNCVRIPSEQLQNQLWFPFAADHQFFRGPLFRCA